MGTRAARAGRRDLIAFAGVSACFALSGFAALLYQTAWLRQFSIVFGTSELAVATVLAAYMAGLGGGAAAAARYVDRIRRPLLAYGILEAGIAITALAVPVLLAGASWLHIRALGGLPEPPGAGGFAQPAYYLLASFLILALPTGFMGATLPLLTRHAVHEDRQVGPRVAWLYGINTAGAVLGTVVAAFMLLPAFGLRATVWVGVAVNGAVFVIAAALAKNLPPIGAAGRAGRAANAAGVEGSVAAEGSAAAKGAPAAAADPATAAGPANATDPNHAANAPTAKSATAAASSPPVGGRHPAPGADVDRAAFRTASSPPAHGGHALGEAATPGQQQAAASSPARGGHPVRLAGPFDPSWILPLMLVSGANAFICEVLWTRILNHALGGTVYAFATMLASFLTGIALGGLLAGRFAGSRRQAGFLFAGCQAAIGLLSAGIYHWLQGFAPAAAGLAANATVAALVILPATLFVGATFPFAVRILANDADDASVAAGRTYAWNTAGAITGSLLAGFFLLPALGFEGTIELAVGVNLLLGVASLFLFSKFGMRVLAPAAVAGALLVAYRPAAPFGLIDTSVVDAGRGGETVFYSVGRSATVFLKRFDGYYYLRTNGLPEAFVEPRGAPPSRHSQKWLTALPVIARPDADSMLIVGFGGGVAVEGIPPSVADVDVIELEPEVIAANAAMAHNRRYDPLADPRVSIVLNDARNALYLTDKRYDIIVSQPSHPWTAGASHLYTSEFIGLAAAHLEAGGVYVQWINSLFVDEPLLRTLTATLFERFDHIRIYQPAPTTLLFLGSNGPLDVEQSVAATGRPLTDDALHYAFMGIDSVEDLVVALTADTAGARRFAAGAPLNTDDRNRLAMFSRAASDGITSEGLHRLFAAYDPLLDQASWLHGDIAGLNLEYIASQLITSGFAHRAADLGDATADRSLALTIQGLGLRHAGLSTQSERALVAAIDADPGNEQAKYALLWRFLGRLAEGNAPGRIEAIAAELDGSAAAVAQGWKYGIDRRWRELAALDGVLAGTDPTDLWYPEAVKLRADWRIQGSDDPADHREAARILDRALMSLPLTDLLVIRAGAAFRLEDAHAFVETAQHVHQQIAARLDRAEQGEYRLSQQTLATMRLRAEGFGRELDAAFVAPVRARAAEVRAHFDDLRMRLER